MRFPIFIIGAERPITIYFHNLSFHWPFEHYNIIGACKALGQRVQYVFASAVQVMLFHHSIILIPGSTPGVTLISCFSNMERLSDAPE
jgi:hypothetical protein